jgi:hypothetical protein
VNRIKGVGSILLGALLFAACQQRTNSGERLQSKSFDAERSTFFTSLATPDEAARQLQAITKEYHRDLLNDPKMFSNYASNPVKAAANLGIYVADLNYSIAYAQAPVVKQYFDAAYELSKAAGVEKRVLEFLKTRYEKNLAKNDSASAVVDALLLKSTRDLQGTEKERIAGIAMAGYQIENLHLALQLFQLHSKDSAALPLFEMIMHRHASVEIIYNFLKTYTDPLDPNKNPNYPYYANAFNDLLATYNKPRTANGSADWMNNVTADLAEHVTAIRSKIVAVE